MAIFVGGSSDESCPQQPGQRQQQQRQADGRAALLPPAPRGLCAPGTQESHQELHDGDSIERFNCYYEFTIRCAAEVSVSIREYRIAFLSW